MYLSRNSKCICLKLLKVFVLNCKIILSQRSGRRDCGRQRPCQGLPGHLDIVSDNLSPSLYLFISRNMGWRQEMLITSSFVWHTESDRNPNYNLIMMICLYESVATSTVEPMDQREKTKSFVSRDETGCLSLITLYWWKTQGLWQPVVSTIWS